MQNVDKQYCDTIKEVLENGCIKDTRAGIVRSIFGKMMKFDLSEGLPILTTKKVFTKGVIHELLWFLNGNTNIKYLVDNNVHIWDDDAYRHYCNLIRKNNELIQKETKQPTWYHEYRNELSIDSKELWLEKVKRDEKQFIIIDEDAYIMSYTPNNWAYEYVYGDLGPVYGHQWRNQFGKDQIKNIIDTLKTNPNDRRIICNAWNTFDLEKMALPPCHVMFQFYTTPLTVSERINELHKRTSEYDNVNTINVEVLDKFNIPKYKLSCLWTQRSCDLGLGFPFNLVSYSILTYMIAQCVNMLPNEVICSLGDVHIYENHIEGLTEQLSRTPFEKLPKVILNDKIMDIDNFTFDDIKIEGYECHSSIKLPLSVG